MSKQVTLDMLHPPTNTCKTALTVGRGLVLAIAIPGIIETYTANPR